MVAALRVGLKGFTAIGDPFDRPLQLARGPRHQPFFGINHLLAAKAAADIGRHDAELSLGNPQHQHPDQDPRDVRQLGRGVERVIAGGGLVLRQGGSRLHRVGDQPVVDEIEPGDVMSPGKGGLGRHRIADRPIAAEIARHTFIELRRIGPYRGDDPSHCRQNPIFDLNAFGGVAGDLDAVGNDHRDRVADMAHVALRQQRMRRLLHRLAVFAHNSPGAWDPVQLVGDDVLGGEDRHDAGLGRRLGLVDCHDLGVGMGRAQKDGIKLARAHDVMHIAPAAGQEAPIFAATKRCPNPIFAHCDLPLPLPFGAHRRR